MTEKSVFRKAWSPEMRSQSFPVSCFWPRGFVPHRNWNLTFLVHQNTGKKNRYRISFFFFAILISTLWRFYLANKRKSVSHIHFKLFVLHPAEGTPVLTHDAFFIMLDLCHKGRNFKHPFLVYPWKEKLWAYCRYVKGVSSLKLHLCERLTLFWKKKKHSPIG